ncbi:hypothetical protein Glove_277g48 [Diversispora epigaea]|uniref:Uncharacterized protein n=1 Tax=Diversispora epigaea TaxID=1348612 RepID=A0A397I2K6_9GLOM|nr:hypothetical protein Glove_277g48 [Diversispora epigaea]
MSLNFPRFFPKSTYSKSKFDYTKNKKKINNNNFPLTPHTSDTNNINRANQNQGESSQSSQEEEGSQLISIGHIISQNELASVTLSQNMKYDIFDEFLEYGVKDKSQFYNSLNKKKNNNNNDNNDKSNKKKNIKLIRTRNNKNNFDVKKHQQENEKVNDRRDNERKRSPNFEGEEPIIKDAEEMRKEIKKRALVDKSNKKPRIANLSMQKRESLGIRFELAPSTHEKNHKYEIVERQGLESIESIKRKEKYEKQAEVKKNDNFKVFQDDFRTGNNAIHNDSRGSDIMDIMDISHLEISKLQLQEEEFDIEEENINIDLKDWHDMKPFMTSTPTDDYDTNVQTRQFSSEFIHYIPDDEEYISEGNVSGCILPTIFKGCEDNEKEKDEAKNEEEVKDVDDIVQKDSKRKKIAKDDNNIQEKETIQKNETHPDPLTIPWQSLNLPSNKSSSKIMERDIGKSERGNNNHKVLKRNLTRTSFEVDELAALYYRNTI